MSNQKPLPEQPESKLPQSDPNAESDWLADLLKTPETGKEIGEDEHVESIGLSPISDLELEKIIRETMSEDWMSASNEEESPETQEEFRDEEFRQTFGTNDILNPAYYTDNGELPEETEDEDSEDLEEDEAEDEEEDYSLHNIGAIGGKPVGGRNDARAFFQNRKGDGNHQNSDGV